MKRLPKSDIEDMYWRKGLSSSEIGIFYEVSDSTILRWMKYYGICRRSLSEAYILMYKLHPERVVQNQKKNEKGFDKSPSSSLAYILGVMLGDGSIAKNHYRLRLEVKSVEFAQKFVENLSKIGMNPYLRVSRHKNKRDGNYRQYQLVGVSRKAFYTWYKSLDLKSIRDWIKGYEQYFVCGFYESEGYIGYNYALNQCIIISNNNRDILSMIKGIMESWGLKPTLRNNTSINFFLCLYGTEYVRNFISMINPCIRAVPRAKNVVLINRRYTEKEYRKVFKMKRQGKTLHDITRLMSIPYTTIQSWIVGGRVPKGIKIKAGEIG